uniref:Uncharacterized protein n=1 Tax=Anguilla anguilla TaxID=7936 RepID=A0A0E9TWI2_ANGAN
MKWLKWPSSASVCSYQTGI